MGNLSNTKASRILPEFLNFFRQETSAAKVMAGAPKSPLDKLFRLKKTPAATPEKADHND